MKWWRLAVLRHTLVVFGHAPSLDRPNLHENWQVLRDSHPPGRIWKPTRPLGHLRPVVPGAGSAPAPSAWKAVMHLSTPPGQNGGAGRLRSVSSALQVRHAAIIITAPKKLDTTAGIAPAAIPVLRTGPFAARARREKTRDSGRSASEDFSERPPSMIAG